MEAFGIVGRAAAALVAAALAAGAAPQAHAAPDARAADAPKLATPPPVADDGSFVTPAFDLPFSSFASPEAAKAAVARRRAAGTFPTSLAAVRQDTDRMLAGLLRASAALYPYASIRSVMGGVPVETFVPASGVAEAEKDRVLIQLHGGGFVAGGGGLGGAVEAVPIAGVGRIKVVAVDYRMGPENHFPAASEDVAAVYRELLKSYRPENIGIYGCSAGGTLTAQAIPWFLKEGLPLPGAIVVLCASTHTFGEGDSAQIWPRFGSAIPFIPPAKPDGTFGRPIAYMRGARPDDPLAVPAASKAVLAKFPPTLFLTGTRAPEMSAASQSHLELRELGVKSELLLFDGMDHGFYADPALPESQAAYKLIVRFFDENLGARR
jgi:acetyl esterase/lipase